MTNQTGVDAKSQATIDLLFEAPEVQLVALFSPEHGIRGAEDKKISDPKDDKTHIADF